MKTLIEKIEQLEVKLNMLTVVDANGHRTLTADRIALPGGRIISREGNDGLHLIGSKGGEIEVTTTPRLKSSSGFWGELQSNGHWTGFTQQNGAEVWHWSIRP